MRYSKAFIPTLKEAPKDAQTPSHIYLLRGGYMRLVGAGVYELLPLGLRVLQNISTIVRDEMNKAGAQELLMPALVPAERFIETGRWDSFGETLLRIKDRHKADYMLAPTHEEIITDLARREIKSYKQLPTTLYQIQMKYRDEPRPRAGLLRCREFLMKDAYSFDVNEEAALKSYAQMKEAYHAIFQRIGLDYRIVAADSGAMGGSTSAEFQVLATTGEDSIVACEACDYAANTEIAEASQLSEGSPCPKCQTPIKSYRGIEAGHIFVLGTHYSEKMNARFLSEQGKEAPFVMGCYGIGISRLIAAAIEQHHDAHGIIWPKSIAPYSVILTSLGNDDAVMSASEKIYQELGQHNIQVLWDERNERPGVKFKDADLLGIPIRITLGAKGLAKQVIELKERHNEETAEIALDQVVSEIKTKRLA